MNETPQQENYLVPLPPVEKLVAALVKAQGQMGDLKRDREVRVTTKTGGAYTFKYATLAAIVEHVRRPLTGNGLWFAQALDAGEGGKYRLVTTLYHDSGQSIASHTPLLVEGTGNQPFGSALTYMRRYALSAMLGLAADEDDDGNAADGNRIEGSRPLDGAVADGAAKAKARVAKMPTGFKPPSPPITIPVGLDSRDQPAWTSWSKDFAEAIGRCTSIPEIEALVAAHEAPLKNLGVAHPTWLGKMEITIAAAKTALGDPAA